MTYHLTFLDKPQLAVYAETNMRRMILQIDETNEKRVEYKLQPMNKKERQFVHELSDLYNIYSTGRDIEPNRYLVLIAEKGNVLLQLLRINSRVNKVRCAFPMVISSEFRMGQYIDDDHREDASHFT